MGWSWRRMTWTSGFWRRHKSRDLKAKSVPLATAIVWPHLKNPSPSSFSSLRKITTIEWPFPQDPSIPRPISEAQNYLPDQPQFYFLREYHHSFYIWMQRKVISLHKNLQGPRTPNTEIIHNNIKPELIIKKKSSSQTSLKDKQSKQKNVSSSNKHNKGEQSPHTKKVKSKSKSKSMKKSGSKADSS